MCLLTLDTAGGADVSCHNKLSALPHAGNEGLEEAIEELEHVKAQCAPITFADLAQLAGVVGAESLGGPDIEFRPGRRDSRVSPPEGRLPAFQNCECLVELLRLAPPQEGQLPALQSWCTLPLHRLTGWCLAWQGLLPLCCSWLA